MKTSLALIFFLATANSIVVASEEPEQGKLELGLGATVLHLPDYIGSDQTRETAWPFPYVRYIGKDWRIDRQLINRELLENKRWRLDLNFSGSLPVNSEDNNAREGMPDLMPTLEVGPWLQYRFAEKADSYWRTDIAIRKAIASDFTDYQNAGWAAQWQLFYRHDWQQHSNQHQAEWSFEHSLALVWGDERQHNYFYGVAPEFVTATRDAYEANAGYGGWRYSAGITRRQGQLWTAAFLRYFDISDAEFVDSPLVRDEQNIALGVAAAWIW